MAYYDRPEMPDFEDPQPPHTLPERVAERLCVDAEKELKKYREHCAIEIDRNMKLVEFWENEKRIINQFLSGEENMKAMARVEKAR